MKLFNDLGTLESDEQLQSLKKQKYEELGRSNWYTLYSLHADSLHNEAKEHIQSMYNTTKKYLDSNFRSEFQRHTINRGRELYIGHTLLSQGYSLIPTKDQGPDFCIELSDKKIWVECVIAKEGSGKNKIPEFGSTTNINDSHIPRILRITSAIQEKIKKYNLYLEQGIVKKNDELYIAVSVDFWDVSDDRIILGAIYGKGLDTFRVNSDNKLEGPYFQKRDSVQKQNETHIDSNILLKEENSFINGVIYSHNNIFDAVTRDETFGIKQIMIFENPYNESVIDWNFGVKYNYDLEANRITHQKTI